MSSYFRSSGCRPETEAVFQRRLRRVVLHEGRRDEQDQRLEGEPQECSQRAWLWRRGWVRPVRLVAVGKSGTRFAGTKRASKFWSKNPKLKFPLKSTFSWPYLKGLALLKSLRVVNKSSMYLMEYLDTSGESNKLVTVRPRVRFSQTTKNLFKFSKLVPLMTYNTFWKQ